MCDIITGRLRRLLSKKRAKNAWLNGAVQALAACGKCMLRGNGNSLSMTRRVNSQQTRLAPA